MLQKIRNFLKTFMIVELGVCVGNIIAECLRHKKHPEYYMMNSAPWYYQIIVDIIIFLIIILITLATWYVLGYVIKRKNKN